MLLPAIARKMRLGRLRNRPHAAMATQLAATGISTSLLQSHRQTARGRFISWRTAPAPASSTSRPATAWTTTISVGKSACRFIRPSMTTESSRTPTTCRSINKCRRGPDRQIDSGKGHGKSEANEAVLHELARAQRAGSSRRIVSSQLPILLAQQDADHLPRDGPVVHQD